MTILSYILVTWHEYTSYVIFSFPINLHKEAGLPRSLGLLRTGPVSNSSQQVRSSVILFWSSGVTPHHVIPPNPDNLCSASCNRAIQHMHNITPGAGWSGVRVSAGAGNFSHHRVQTGPGVHPASYPMGTRGSYSGGKAAGAWSWTLTSIYCRSQECVELYLQSPNTPSWCGGRLKHRENFTFTFTTAPLWLWSYFINSSWLDNLSGLIFTCA
jgi:hypothetical protein